MRRFLGVIFACASLCGLAVAICATPRPQPIDHPIVISINCDTGSELTDTPFFDIEYEFRASTTIQWTNNSPKCSGNVEIHFKGDTPLTEVDSSGKTIKVREVSIAEGQMSKAYGVLGVPGPPQDWSPPSPEPKSKKHYKTYKYDLTVGSITIDPGGGVRP